MPRPDESPVKRQLSRAQMAFVRCWAEGLDLQSAWDRYLFLNGSADPRRVRAELRRLLDALRQLARAQGRPDVATLLRRDPQAIADRGAPLPTLEEFRARQPADFYSEAELAALYRDEFGAPDSRGPERRRQRLRERLVLALQWLERVGVRDPVRDDRLAAWLDERIAGRLSAAGLGSLGDLLARIAARGPRWHRGIPRVGPMAAARLQRWLVEHEATLGVLPAAHEPALAPAATPQAGIVPLERQVPPAGLDGAHGTNRAPTDRCRIAASTDIEAIGAWLDRRGANGHTWRAYRREAERFLAWATLERAKPLSSLDGADCAAYRAFLAAPGAAWTGPRNTPRASPAWRPFEGPLSPRSALSAVAILRALCAWLVRQRYLAANPWDDVAPPPVVVATNPPLRALAPAQWARIDAWLGAQPPSPAQRRLRLIVAFAYRTGLRLSELAAACLGWLRNDPRASGRGAWWLVVPGTRRRELPLAADAVATLRRSLADRGLDPDPKANDAATPLLARLAGEAPLSAARIHQVLVQAFGRCADEVAVQDGRDAERIRQATARWLRHTHGAHAVARGVPQAVLQERLGHRSPVSTAVYAAAGPDRLSGLPGSGDAETFRDA